MAPDKDYYSVLGVPPDTGADQIRKAFRERVRACHPDRVANLDEDLRRLAEEKMVELNEAYAVLRNPARRAAYDHRISHRQAVPPAVDSSSATISAFGSAAATVESRPFSPPGGDGGPLVDPGASRSRIGEQRFVARAASEEFQLTLKRCLTGRPTWTPMAFPGATLAVRGTRGRNSYSFVFLAAPQIDNKALRQFLKSLRASTSSLRSGLFRRGFLFGFVGAVEFLEQRRQRQTLDRFNDGLSGNDPVRPATLVDLVNWHVVPGEISLEARVENLLRGS